MGTVVLAFIILAVYFLPALVASDRHHRNASAITALNLLLGWTFVGWVVAIVWALTDNVEKVEKENLVSYLTFKNLTTALLFIVAAYVCAYAWDISHVRPAANLMPPQSNKGFSVPSGQNIAYAGEIPRPSLPSSDGKWTMTQDSSPIDDSKNVYLDLAAENTMPGTLGLPKTPVLIIRCKEHKTEMFITFDAYLGLNEISITSRIDKAKAQSRAWRISSDSKGAFVSGSNIDWIKALFNHESLVVQLTPYNAPQSVVTFNIRGLEHAIKPLQEACHWK